MSLSIIILYMIHSFDNAAIIHHCMFYYIVVFFFNASFSCCTTLQTVQNWCSVHCVNKLFWSEHLYLKLILLKEQTVAFVHLLTAGHLLRLRLLINFFRGWQTKAFWECDRNISTLGRNYGTDGKIKENSFFKIVCISAHQTGWGY